jgi:osmoprotectant transport system substrate-binding protein
MKIKKSILGAGLGAAALLLAACGGNANPLGQPSSGAPSASGGGAAPIVVGSADFSESQILGELYAQALKAKGIDASTKPNIGAREVYIKALKEGDISIVPEYTGNLLINLDKNATATTSAEIEAALPKALPTGLKVLKSSAAADQDVYVVTKDYSAKNGVTSLADLKKVASTAVLGGPSTLETRPYGVPGLSKIYGAKFKSFQPYDKLAVKIKDLNDNKIQVGEFFTTQSAIADNGYVELKDPQSMILPQNVIPLVSSAVADNATATAAIEAVQAALTTADLVTLDKAVDSNHQDPDQVAADWLKAKGLA